MVVSDGIYRSGGKRRTNTAVVWSLRTRETPLWPAERSAVDIEECVLLLKTEPRFVILGLIHDLLGMMAIVGAVGSAIVVVGLSEDNDIVSTTEWVFENGSWSEVDVRIVARGLVGR